MFEVNRRKGHWVSGLALNSLQIMSVVTTG